jgi:putative transposase
MMTLAATEFLRRSLDRARDRFLLHVLPAGFVRIRHFGFLANRTATAKLARPAVSPVEWRRALLAAAPRSAPAAAEPLANLMFRLTGVDITRCPTCHLGRLHVVAIFRPGHLPAPVLDSS